MNFRHDALVALVAAHARVRACVTDRVFRTRTFSLAGMEPVVDRTGIGPKALYS